MRVRSPPRSLNLSSEDEVDDHPEDQMTPPATLPNMTNTDRDEMEPAPEPARGEEQRNQDISTRPMNEINQQVAQPMSPTSPPPTPTQNSQLINTSQCTTDIIVNMNTTNVSATNVLNKDKQDKLRLSA